MTRWQCMARNLGFSVGVDDGDRRERAMPNVSSTAVGLRAICHGSSLRNSCYLPSHTETYLLWDARPGTELIGRPAGPGNQKAGSN